MSNFPTGINFPTGFNTTSNEPIDSRLILTKAQMYNAHIDLAMPDTYFAICSDDDRIYIYKSSNSVDTYTGKFRLLTKNLPVTDNKTIEVEVLSSENQDIEYKLSIKGKEDALDGAVLRKHITNNTVTYTWDQVYSKNEVYNKNEIDSSLNAKQNNLIVGDNINISNNVISAVGDNQLDPTSNRLVQNGIVATTIGNTQDVIDGIIDKVGGTKIKDQTEVTGTLVNDLANKQYIEDNTLTTTTKRIPDAINEVNSIAKGANQSLSYQDYLTFITFFNSLNQESDYNRYNIGQNIFILTKEVPDLWIYDKNATYSAYTYTTDSAIVNALLTNGYIQVGYYLIGMLETNKVDLTNYYTKSEADNSFATKTALDSYIPTASSYTNFLKPADTRRGFKWDPIVGDGHLGYVGDDKQLSQFEVNNPIGAYKNGDIINYNTPINEIIFKMLHIPTYLTFSSPNSFTLNTANLEKNWDGTLEYSTNATNWTTWNGTTINSTVNGDIKYLYLRGLNNTKITGSSSNNNWVLTGSNISCTGNIENLLDYQTVLAGNHPAMTNYCYRSMFSNCTSLTMAPALPATTLAERCYEGMFYGCTNLTTAPALPAITLAERCYMNMFASCANLITAPLVLPATSLADYCYQSMFSDCTSLVLAPALPATTLAVSCYYSMFSGCTSLTTAPALPATTLANLCYSNMFNGCTSLITTPELLATTLNDGCYASMFANCTNLTVISELPATTLDDYCYEHMFSGCTSLTTLPELPATTLADYCYQSMFYGCTNIKLSDTPTGDYQTTYRVPASGIGIEGTDSLTGMFTSTGGTFTGTPTINTTYYTSNDLIV